MEQRTAIRPIQRHSRATDGAASWSPFSTTFGPTFRPRLLRGVQSRHRVPRPRGRLKANTATRQNTNRVCRFESPPSSWAPTPTRPPARPWARPAPPFTTGLPCRSEARVTRTARTQWAQRASIMPLGGAGCRRLGRRPSSIRRRPGGPHGGRAPLASRLGGRTANLLSPRRLRRTAASPPMNSARAAQGAVA